MISMFVTFTICGAVYGFYIENRVWDYAITVTILHTLASCFGKFHCVFNAQCQAGFADISGVFFLISPFKHM